ncbi:MAG: hypothetical protein IJ793_02715 [Opitutales bacterium]|nr:hypothetical protein [Opitutales bacterium]
MLGSVEAEPVAEVVVPVAGFAETVAPVAVEAVTPVAVFTPEFVAGTVVTPEAVAPDVPVVLGTVAEVDEGTRLEVPVGAVFVGRTDA